jgi:hypothetical protein
VLGLTARIQRFGGYATDEVALAFFPGAAREHIKAEITYAMTASLVRPGQPDIATR